MRRAAIAALLVAAAAIAVSACGGGGTSTTPAATASVAPAQSTPLATSPTAATATAAIAPSPSPSPAVVAASPTTTTPLAACATAPGSAPTARASSEGATRSIVLVLSLSAAAGPCHFEGSLAVIIEDANGNPQRITGNGASVPVSANLPASITLSWSNWCAAQVPFKADIRLGGQTLLAPLPMPSCTNPTGPSTLVAGPAS